MAQEEVELAEDAAVDVAHETPAQSGVFGRDQRASMLYSDWLEDLKKREAELESLISAKRQRILEEDKRDALAKAPLDALLRTWVKRRCCRKKAASRTTQKGR